MEHGSFIAECRNMVANSQEKKIIIKQKQTTRSNELNSIEEHYYIL